MEQENKPRGDQENSWAGEETHTLAGEFEKALEDFCSFITYPEVKGDLWYAVMTALGTDGSLYDDGEQRTRLLFLYEKLEKLLDAIFIRSIHQQMIEQPKIKTDGARDGK